MRLGIDFDNTIAGYDPLIVSVARRLGLVPADFAGGKKEVRDTLRLGPDGEREWMRLQGRIYGHYMPEAILIDGVAEVLTRARERAIPVFIVSHKTEFGHFDPDRINLRDAALRWMEDKSFFRADGFAVPRENVFFAATRGDKLARIRALGCTHFVDDLEEIFADPEFPSGVRRILFTGGRPAPAGNSMGEPFQACADWRAVADALFSECPV